MAAKFFILDSQFHDVQPAISVDLVANPAFLFSDAPATVDTANPAAGGGDTNAGTSVAFQDADYAFTGYTGNANTAAGPLLTQTGTD